LKSLREQNSKAEAEADQLTSILMSNLNDGTAVEIKQQEFKGTSSRTYNVVEKAFLYKHK
jgi:hypothetical protein